MIESRESTLCFLKLPPWSWLGDSRDWETALELRRSLELWLMAGLDIGLMVAVESNDGGSGLRAFSLDLRGVSPFSERSLSFSRCSRRPLDPGRSSDLRPVVGLSFPSIPTTSGMTKSALPADPLRAFLRKEPLGETVWPWGGAESRSWSGMFAV